MAIFTKPSPKFVSEFALRTKWNYFKLRLLKEKDEKKRSEFEANLAQIRAEMESNEYTIEEIYEVTQLLNSMIGLLVFPEQGGYDDIPTKYSEFESQFPILYKCINNNDYKCNYLTTNKNSKYYGKPEAKSPRNVIRHLKNAVSHNRIGVFPQGGMLEADKKVIKSVVFRDELSDDNLGKMEFEICVDIDDLEGLLLEICDTIIRLANGKI